jgi:poly(hydroxyalkanoate) depolymerase family esterase
MMPRLAALSSVLLLSACSSSDPSPGNPTVETPDADVAEDALFEQAADAPAEASLPESATDSTSSYSGSHIFSGPPGSRRYVVHVPDGLGSAAAPLVLVLHGCYQTPEKMQALTRWDALADEQKLVTVYPEQPSEANSYQCWNWFEPAHQTRESGEPAILQAIVAEVASHVAIDGKRVFVSGLSAGGAMAVVMAATWPDQFAAAGVVAGCPYKGTPCLQAPSSMSPETLASLVHAAMGSHARVVPMMVMQGDADTTVPPANAELLVKQWLGAGDLADDGQANATISLVPAKTSSGTAPGGEPYQVDTYESGGASILERWLIQPMAHAWPGGSATEAFADPNGPDGAREIQRFLNEHPMP